MYIEEIIKAIPDRLQAIEERQAEILNRMAGEVIQPEQDEKLLTTHDILRRLGMKPTQKGWKVIKTEMQQKYGLTKHPGIGYRMTLGNYKRYLKEQFHQS